MSNGRPIGRVVAIYRHPVKSMRGEEVEQARLYWHGLEGDRRYGFVQAGDLSRFPWFTGREHPPLLRYSPAFEDPAQPATSPVRVTCPDGEQLAIEDPALRERLERESGMKISLLHLGRSAVDSMALSLISTATLRSISEATGIAVGGRRFRNNLVIEADEDRPFAEDAWLGSTLTIGREGARVRLLRQNQRCMMINLDPETAIQQPSVLRHVVKERGQMAAIYGSTDQVGSVSVGDELWLSD